MKDDAKQGLRLLVLALLAFLCVRFISVAGATGAEGATGTYRTLPQVHEDAKAGWHQTYTAHGREITVDIDIQVPGAEAFPVVRVKAAEPAAPEDADGYATLYIEQGAATMTFGKGSPENENPGPTVYNWKRIYTPQDADWTDAPEDMPMTLEAAHALFLEAAARYFGPDVKDGFFPYRMYVTGREYHVDRLTGKASDQAATEMGGLVIEYAGAHGGIPVITIVKPDMNHDQVPGYGGALYMYAPDNYVTNFAALSVTETVLEDAPLAPLSDVIKSYEALIESGNIRSVKSLELGYAMYPDKAEKGAGWLIPTWVLNAEYYEDAQREAHIMDGEPLVIYYGIVVDAQTLQAVDPLAYSYGSTGFPGAYPARETLITWEGGAP